MEPRAAGRSRFTTFEEFWPFYVAMHSRPSTRRTHAIGTLLGAAIALHGLLTRRPWRVLALPLCGYGASWPGHWFIERNNPAAFGNPLWSFRGDLQMIRHQLTGRDLELQAIAEAWLAEHPEDRSAGSAPVDELPAAA